MIRIDIQSFLLKLQKYYHEHAHIPSYEQLKTFLGVKSKRTVFNYIHKLIEWGFLIKMGNILIPTDKFTGIAYYESVRAGLPSPATDDTKYQIDLNKYLVDHPFSTFTVKVKGDSMKDAGINEWDLVIVDKSRKHKVHDIVVGQLDGEFTLKYYMIDSQKRAFFRAANSEYQDMYAKDELLIFGVVVGLVRKYG